MLRHRIASRVTALGCVVLVGSLLLPGQATAETPVKPASVREAAKAVVEKHVGTMKASRAAQQGTNANPDLQSGSFFKRPVGIAVLVAFVAGAGYAAYSASNDRIKGSGR